MSKNKLVVGEKIKWTDTNGNLHIGKIMEVSETEIEIYELIIDWAGETSYGVVGFKVITRKIADLPNLVSIEGKK